jgi:hypothetical protein
MTEESATRPSITVKGEVILVAVFSVVAAACHAWMILEFPAAYVKGEHTLPSVLMALTMWLGQALWVTMDRRRHGLLMGAWRYAVLLTGPFAVAWYIILQYRLRALYLIPLALIPYAFVLGLPLLIVL